MDKFYSNTEYFQGNVMGKKDVIEQVTTNNEQPNALPQSKLKFLPCC